MSSYKRIDDNIKQEFCRVKEELEQFLNIETPTYEQIHSFQENVVSELIVKAREYPVEAAVYADELISKVTNADFAIAMDVVVAEAQNVCASAQFDNTQRFMVALHCDSINDKFKKLVQK